MSVYYEWVIETVEREHEDIVDVDHRDTYAEVEEWVSLTRTGPNYFLRVGLVKTTDRDRGWAYVENGAIPARFENAMGGDMGKVPGKYLKQFASRKN